MNAPEPVALGQFEFDAAGVPATASLYDDGAWRVVSQAGAPLAGLYERYLNALFGPGADWPSYLASRALVVFCSAYEALDGTNGWLAPDTAPKGQVN
jgi:hypothetical protein